MDIIIKDTYEEMSKAAFELFKQNFDDSEVIGFATGRTPIGLYRLISEECMKGKMSFKGKRSFNLDEYFPIAQSDIEIYRDYMQKNLFSKIDIKKGNINFPDATLPEQEAVFNYKEVYARHGPIDLQILGIGANGHIAFNEPGSDTESTIRIAKLSKETMLRNKTNNDRAITMGIKEILESKRIILLASGKDKSEAVRMAIAGNVDKKVPASFLQLHKQVTFLLDKDAAGAINQS